jgi:ADP-ribosylglycohydrolase
VDRVLALDPGEPVDADAFVADVARYVETPRFLDKLAAVREIAAGGTVTNLGTLGSGVAAHASVPTALACFLLYPDSFQEAVKAAISLGGDTDTIAAMTGALVGSRLGLAVIPESWLDVEGRAELVALADRLVDS